METSCAGQAGTLQILYSHLKNVVESWWQEVPCLGKSILHQEVKGYNPGLYHNNGLYNVNSTPESSS